MSDSGAIGFNKSETRRVVILLALITGVLTVIALYPQIFGPTQTEDNTDIYDHLRMVQNMGLRGPWNLYSLFFILTYVLSFGSKNFYLLGLVGMAVMTAAVVAKAILSYYLVEKAAPSKPVAGLISLALILAMPLPNWWNPDEIYLDKIAPTVWFNSTAILNLPFDVLLFFAALKWLKSQTVRSSIWLAVFSVLSVLTKPNYLLAFFPVLGFIVLARAVAKHNWRAFHTLLFCTGLALVLGSILVAQYFDTFTGTSSVPKISTTEVSPLEIAPLLVWSQYSPNITASLLLSIAFPLSVTALWFKQIKNNAAVTLAWAVFAFALLQYMLLAERGEALEMGNWGWGSNFALYILFLVSTMVLLSQPRSPRFYFAAILFGFHVASGIYYYLKVARGAGYY
jgi:hypothetical protein